MINTFAEERRDYERRERFALTTLTANTIGVLLLKRDYFKRGFDKLDH